MAKAFEVVENKRYEFGMPFAELARRMEDFGCEIREDLLSKTLHGERAMKADELVASCVVLKLTLDDFI